ncbi:MAG: hypothetical protein ACRDKJ_10690 [Actinomycetota bacterium]
MRIWQKIGRARLIKTTAIGVTLAVATMAPGGAFVAGATGGAAPAQRLGGSFDAFILALADEVVRSTGMESQAITADVNVADFVHQSISSALAGETQSETTAEVDEEAVAQQVINSIQNINAAELPSLPTVDVTDETAAAQAQEEQMAQASTADVVAALLQLLTSAQPQVLAAIDAGEAAVIAKLTQARAQVIAAFDQASGAGAGGLDELEAFALQQIDAAIVMIGQVFDQIRAMVVAAFAEAAERIVEELTGIDFGDAVDEVLADIAAIQTWLTNALAGVQQILEDLGAGLPLP